MDFTTLLVPTYRNMLRMLLGLLGKAEAQLGAVQAEALLSARLAPDMYPLATQLRFAAMQALDGARYLRGEPWTGEHDEMIAEARNGREHPGTLAQAAARIDQALAYLDSLEDGALDVGPEDRPILLELPDGRMFDLTAGQFVRDWALGQFYFHVMAAYAILRQEGVEIGKADYVPHMFAYMRGIVPEPAAEAAGGGAQD
jgi:uncharacterized protein